MAYEVSLGIVGSEDKKFTPETREIAYVRIRELCGIHFNGRSVSDCRIVSGGCHLGGVDKFAIDVAKELGLGYLEHLPARRSWRGGYKDRNIRIAEDSDIVVCITVKDFPADYVGLRFPYCYHCGTSDHIKSGGCWTTKYARSIGKQAYTIVV